MACTALTPNGKKVVVITNQTELGLYIALYEANDQFEPIGQADEFGDPTMNEEQFHRGLRKEADIKGHYVPQYSTNPDWSPGSEGSKLDNI